VEKCNRPTLGSNVYQADINQPNSLLNSVEWDETLRDFDINSAWTYFSSKFNSCLKESIPMLVKKERKICASLVKLDLFEEQKKPIVEKIHKITIPL